MSSLDTLDRNQYLAIIEEVRNLERFSLDSFIEKKLVPAGEQDSNFLKVLYKDINYILADVDEAGDNDLIIENGDFVIEDGDLKLSGYQTNLHYLIGWLHMQLVAETITSQPLERIEHTLETFETDFLGRITYTPEYRTKLDLVKASIIQERKHNYKNKKWKRKSSMPLEEIEVSAGFKFLGIMFRFRRHK